MGLETAIATSILPKTDQVIYIFRVLWNWAFNMLKLAKWTKTARTRHYCGSIICRLALEREF